MTSEDVIDLCDSQTTSLQAPNGRVADSEVIIVEDDSPGVAGPNEDVELGANDELVVVAATGEVRLCS